MTAECNSSDFQIQETDNSLLGEIFAKRIGRNYVYDPWSGPTDKYTLVDSRPFIETVNNAQYPALFIYCDCSYVCIGSQGKSICEGENKQLQMLVSSKEMQQISRLILVTGNAITKESISFIQSVLITELEKVGWSQSGSVKKLDIVGNITALQQSESVLEDILIRLARNRIQESSAEKAVDTYNLPDEVPEILSSIWDVLHEIGCSDKTMPDSIRNLLISKYSPRLNLDSNQKRILNQILGHPDKDHIILGGAGTGKTLLLFKTAAELDKRAQTVTDREDPANGRTALIFQNNFKYEGTDIEAQYHTANVGIYSIGSFTADVVKMLEDPTKDIRFSTIFVDEGHGLPSFKTGKFGKTSNGFRTQWYKHYSVKDDAGNPVVFSLSKYFNGELPGKWKYSGKPVKDYIDLFHYLKEEGKIRNVVICYDSDQWVYSGSIGRQSDFRFHSEETVYHSMHFITHRLEHQYRISPKGDSDSGTDFVKGIRYFLQLDTDDNFNRALFKEDPSGNVGGQKADSYFGISKSIQDLFDYVDEMKTLHPGSHNRVVAGYAVDWNRRKKPGEKVWFDTDITDNTNNGWAWNDAQEGFVYDVNSEERHRHQVGSVFAVQGQDLDYVGVIVANDIRYDGQEVRGVPERYKHSSGSIPQSEKDLYGVDYYNHAFDQQIRGIYYVLLTRGIHGIRVFFQDKALERHFKRIMGIEQ